MNEPAPAIRRPATYQDVLDAPPHLVAELVGGVLHLQPRPASRHARASLKLGARLDDPFENGVGGPGGWSLAIEPEARTLEAFALRAGAWVLTVACKDDDEIRAAPFEAAGFPLSALWPD